MTEANKNIEGYKFIREAGGVAEYELSVNGLRVLALEDGTTPTSTLMVTYHVGSRNEALGYTGSTHILEHMMFKGSAHFNRGNGKIAWTLLEGKGAKINATTWTDRTNYYELLPSEHLSSAIEFEADRMRHAMFDANDLSTEMTVVRNEFEIGENEPLEILHKHMWATAFQAHPYHHSTIGWKSDIESISVDRLRDFYNTYYWPNNATVTVIGYFDLHETLGKIRDEFGRLNRSPKEIPPMTVVEPVQEGERRFRLERAGEANYVAIAYKVPGLLDKDRPALDVAGVLLTAPRKGILYKKLVDEKLASDVALSTHPFRDENLFIIHVALTKGVKPEKVERIVVDELARMARDVSKPKEVEKVVLGLMAKEAFARDGSFALASVLNECIAAGDWTYAIRYENEVATVTPASVRDVCKKYFVFNNRTIGTYISTNTK